jgi:hypothetical protein
MAETSHLEDLLEAVELIARHPDYPGKADVIRRCTRDIEDRHRAGTLTTVEKAKLLRVLRGEGAMGWRRDPESYV